LAVLVLGSSSSNYYLALCELYGEENRIFFSSVPITKKIVMSVPSLKLMLQMPLFIFLIGEHNNFAGFF